MPPTPLFAQMKPSSKLLRALGFSDITATTSRRVPLSTSLSQTSICLSVCLSIYPSIFLSGLTGLFHKFLHEEAKSMDWRGLLSLYEASQYGTNDEEILSNAMDFSKKKLLNMQNTHLTPQKLVKIADTIGYPRHQRIERFETWRWIQEGTGFAENSSPILEFAAIDYKMVQVQHQKELAELTRWWKDLRLGKKISFARDQPLEFFLWATGIFPDPTQSVCRMELARFVPILLLLDALYDNYGSLEELTLFTDAIRRFEALNKRVYLFFFSVFDGYA